MSDKVSKVLHVAPTPFFADRGCHIRIRGIALSLEDADVDSLVCTYPIGRDVEGVRSVRTVRIPGYSKTEAGPSAFKYIADLLLVFVVARQLRKYQPDILHCHLHEGVLIGWVARFLAMNRSVPIVFDMQGSLTGELAAHGHFTKRRILRKAFELLERKIVSLADLYFCSSQASVDLLTGVFDVDPSNVNLVRDGIDIIDRSIDSGIERPAGWENDRIPIAVYSGGLTESKGIGVLREILLEAARRDLAIRFLIIGYPTEALEEFVLGNGLRQQCNLIGQVPYEHLAGHLGSADIALEPKMSGSGEASGKVVNYMAAGLPVICFDTPNNRDMLGDNGYAASENTAAAFVDQVQSALSDPVEARTRGLAGVDRAFDRFSWRAGAQIIINAYALVHNSTAHSGRSNKREEV
jgi:glycosyltransferase involved in cell wall biosynthesis